MHFNSNIRFLRTRSQFTQEKAAAELGISRATLNSYENGSVINPTLEALLNFSKYYGVSIDTLIKIDLSKISETNLAELEGGHDAYIKGSKLRVLATSIDSHNKENIEVVNLKAAAGYRNGYADPDYIKRLPSFQLPILFNDRKYRMFQISGDSMFPIEDKSWVITEYVENWFEIKDGNGYIILTHDDGIVFKIAYNQLRRKKKLTLRSLNPLFEPYEISAGDIREVWKFCNYISSKIPEPNFQKDELLSAVTKMEKEIKVMKEKMEKSLA
ncbi:MAG TPA: DNA-binding protein [Bacteroidetes bacterium]|nr:DNA-binding protein [Bacteroidota bacterium]